MGGDRMARGCTKGTDRSAVVEELRRAITCAPIDGPLRWVEWRDRMVSAAWRVIADAEVRELQDEAALARGEGKTDG